MKLKLDQIANLQNISLHNKPIYSVDIHPDGDHDLFLCAVLDDSKNLQIFKLEEKQPGFFSAMLFGGGTLGVALTRIYCSDKELGNHYPTCCRFQPGAKSKCFVALSPQNALVFFTSKSGDFKDCAFDSRLSFPDSAQLKLRNFSFREDGKFLAVTSSDKIIIVDAESRKEQARIVNIEAHVVPGVAFFGLNFLAFSSSMHSKERVSFWRIAQGRRELAKDLTGEPTGESEWTETIRGGDIPRKEAEIFTHEWDGRVPASLCVSKRAGVIVAGSHAKTVQILSTTPIPKKNKNNNQQEEGEEEDNNDDANDESEEEELGEEKKMNNNNNDNKKKKKKRNRENYLLHTLRSEDYFNDAVLACAVDDNAQVLVTACADGLVRLFALNDPKFPEIAEPSRPRAPSTSSTKPQQPQPVTCIALSPRYILVGDLGSQLTVYKNPVRDQRWKARKFLVFAHEKYAAHNVVQPQQQQQTKQQQQQQAQQQSKQLPKLAEAFQTYAIYHRSALFINPFLTSSS